MSASWPVRSIGRAATMARAIRGDFGLAGAVQEIGGAGALPAHAHVERTVGLEGEAALGPVELHRRDADIESDAVDRLHAAVGKRLTHPGKALRHKRQAPPARSG